MLDTKATLLAVLRITGNTFHFDLRIIKSKFILISSIWGSPFVQLSILDGKRKNVTDHGKYNNLN